MGLLDNLKNVLGGKKDGALTAATKAPSQVLKENGVDPSDLKFAFGADGAVTITGQVQQEADKARIKKILTGIPGIKQVKLDASVATASGPVATSESTESPAAPDSDDAPATATQSGEAGAQAATTYTVQAGDTLWKIAKQHYGDGSQYLKIFEANKGLLENPDHILPGQELVIPEKDG